MCCERRLPFVACEVYTGGGSVFPAGYVLLTAAAATKISLHNIDWSVEEPLFTCTVNGNDKPLRCQHVERLSEGFKLVIEGAIADVVRACAGRSAVA